MDEQVSEDSIITNGESDDEEYITTDGESVDNISDETSDTAVDETGESAEDYKYRDVVEEQIIDDDEVVPANGGYGENHTSGESVVLEEDGEIDVENSEYGEVVLEEDVSEIRGSVDNEDVLENVELNKDNFGEFIADCKNNSNVIYGGTVEAKSNVIYGGTVEAKATIDNNTLVYAEHDIEAKATIDEDTLVYAEYDTDDEELEIGSNNIARAYKSSGDERITNSDDINNDIPDKDSLALCIDDIYNDKVEKILALGMDDINNNYKLTSNDDINTQNNDAETLTTKNNNEEELALENNINISRISDASTKTSLHNLVAVLQQQIDTQQTLINSLILQLENAKSSIPGQTPECLQAVSSAHDDETESITDPISNSIPDSESPIFDQSLFRTNTHSSFFASNELDSTEDDYIDITFSYDDDVSIIGEDTDPDLTVVDDNANKSNTSEDANITPHSPIHLVTPSHGISSLRNNSTDALDSVHDKLNLGTATHKNLNYVSRNLDGSGDSINTAAQENYETFAIYLRPH
uniref:Uncharacterized protein n=1 Tax=Aureoumbra lagunensis TaxID=44058 RepID=A0A7S3K3H1_9STRA